MAEAKAVREAKAEVAAEAAAQEKSKRQRRRCCVSSLKRFRGRKIVVFFLLFVIVVVVVCALNEVNTQWRRLALRLRLRLSEGREKMVNGKW